MALKSQTVYQRFLRTKSSAAKKPPGQRETLREKQQRLIVPRVGKYPKTKF